MQNFTELFTRTLNDTLATLVADAVATRVAALEETIEQLHDRIKDLEDTDRDDNLGTAIEQTIESYDFSDIISNELDWNSISGETEFNNAVISVIRDALRG